LKDACRVVDVDVDVDVHVDVGFSETTGNGKRETGKPQFRRNTASMIITVTAWPTFV
jgi:hypothetical protein